MRREKSDNDLLDSLLAEKTASEKYSQVINVHFKETTTRNI